MTGSARPRARLHRCDRCLRLTVRRYTCADAEGKILRHLCDECDQSERKRREEAAKQKMKRGEYAPATR